MNLHTKKTIDYEIPLENEAHEAFCQEYVRLDIEDRVISKRYRRVLAYKFAFPEDNVNDEAINQRAFNLIRRKECEKRIEYIYNLEGTSIENLFTWTRSKSEEALLELAFGEGVKPGDKLRAIAELNKMRGLDAPVVAVEEEKKETDSVADFFSRIRKSVGGE